MGWPAACCLIARAGLDGLGEEAAAFTREAYMAIEDALAHWHGKRHAEAADKVFALVAVKNNGVDETHGSFALIKIQAHGEGQPFAAALRAFVHAVDFHHRAHRAVLFEGHFFDFCPNIFRAWVNPRDC